MRTITLHCGTRLEDAAAALVAHAPACAEFNGIKLVARYATTQPRDIERQYRLTLEHQGAVWRASPAGKRAAAERAATVAKHQRIVDECMSELGELRLDDPLGEELDAILRWTERIADAADDVDVRLDRASLRLYFAEHGWQRGAFCGDEFRPDDPRVHAGWIVGQWLDCWYPGVSTFAQRWREQFMRTA